MLMMVDRLMQIEIFLFECAFCVEVANLIQSELNVPSIEDGTQGEVGEGFATELGDVCVENWM